MTRKYEGLPTTYIAWHDITARKKAEVVRSALEARIAKGQKFEALGTLAGGVAHDFNNILTGIINYTSLAKVDCPATHPQIRDFLNEVLNCSNRAKELVRQIMLFSRSEEAERLPLLLQHVMKEVLSLLRSSLPANVTMEASIDEDAPVMLGNATQLHQIMMNLGINACHAMQEHPGHLRIRMHQRIVDSKLVVEVPELSEGAFVYVEVSDTGCGMQPEVLARIFEPFFTTKKVGEGTGLGLAVVQSIVKSHRGVINVRSQPGKGTTFELYFPVHRRCTPIEAGGPAEIRSGRGERILLVDDEPIVAKSIQLMMERSGYRVSLFTDPNVALAQFWSAPDEFDLLITDFQMPGMTGVDLAGKILAHRPEMPIFVMSGFAGSLATDRIRRSGITRFVSKPIDAVELADHMAELFDQEASTKMGAQTLPKGSACER